MLAQIILQQIIVMFLLVGVGYLLFKTGKLTLEANKGLGQILLYLSLPCVIINGFRVEATAERYQGLGLSLLMSLVLLVAGSLVSRLLNKKGLDVFAGAFSNPGFFGVPIIVSALKPEAVFYLAPFIAFLNLFQWTYGVRLIQGQGSPVTPSNLKQEIQSLGKRLATAPFMVATVIGLILFITQITLPTVLGNTLTTIAGLNTPLAMFTIGVYLAQVEVEQMVTKVRLYWVSLVKLVIVPLVALGILLVLPKEQLELKLSLLIAMACPVGSNIAVYAQLHDSDYGYAVETVIHSTLLSIVTIPLIVTIGQVLF